MDHLNQHWGWNPDIIEREGKANIKWKRLALKNHANVPKEIDMNEQKDILFLFFIVIS